MFSSKLNVSDYSLFVFDLDNTLFLHSVNNAYKIKYEKQLGEFLNYLKNNNKKLVIASHNQNPNLYLEQMKISELFDDVIGQYPRDKLDMINHFLENTKSQKTNPCFSMIK